MSKFSHKLPFIYRWLPDQLSRTFSDFVLPLDIVFNVLPHVCSTETFVDVSSKTWKPHGCCNKATFFVKCLTYWFVWVQLTGLHSCKHLNKCNLMRFDQIQMPVFFFFIQNKKKKSKKDTWCIFFIYKKMYSLLHGLPVQSFQTSSCSTASSAEL